MADDRLQVAIDTVARHALAYAAETAAAEDWEIYPDLGRDDWLAVGRRVQELAPTPPKEEYAAAYEYLESRAGEDA